MDFMIRYVLEGLDKKEPFAIFELKHCYWI